MTANCACSRKRAASASVMVTGGGTTGGGGGGFCVGGCGASATAAAGAAQRQRHRRRRQRRRRASRPIATPSRSRRAQSRRRSRVRLHVAHASRVRHCHRCPAGCGKPRANVAISACGRVGKIEPPDTRIAHETSDETPARTAAACGPADAGGVAHGPCRTARHDQCRDRTAARRERECGEISHGQRAGEAEPAQSARAAGLVSRAAGQRAGERETDRGERT